MIFKIFDKSLLEERTASIDVYRGIAILLVVFFHFKDIITVGFIGVDLFFVISGYLVSKVLIKELFNESKINWKSFLIKRFSKILPSYYFFIIFGLVVARLILLPEFPEQVISLNKLKNFLFFYANYDMPLARGFAITWSLCVEEHFYLFLLFFVLIINSIMLKMKKMVIFKWGIILFIIISILFKLVGQVYGWEIYNATHMRMDSLFLGVLLTYQEKIEKKDFKTNNYSLIIGVVILIVTITAFYVFDEIDYTNGVLHSLIPLGFYFLIKGSLHYKFKRFNIIRYIAYYSYNWYLWHILIGFIILNKFNLPNYIDVLVYLVLSFSVAVLVTKLVEEPILKLRSKFIKK